MSTSSASSSFLEEALVSVIIPVYNAGRFIKEALGSVVHQSYRNLEVVVFDDSSDDDSLAVLESFREVFSECGIRFRIEKSHYLAPKGPGYARNEAISSSSGEYLCHLDADDYMDSRRIELQLQLALEKGKDCLVGCNFNRLPSDSTPYYTDWLNSMNDEDLVLQQFRECTVICPSWFMHRQVFDKVANHRSRCGTRAFVENDVDKILKRIPEDTFFFLDHLQLGGSLSKVPIDLITYRYTPGSWALGTKKEDLQKVRLRCNILQTPLYCRDCI
jgi:glycosyltransferase involved in cell wall biosynthesis